MENHHLQEVSACWDSAGDATQFLTRPRSKSSTIPIQVQKILYLKKPTSRNIDDLQTWSHCGEFHYLSNPMHGTRTKKTDAVSTIKNVWKQSIAGNKYKKNVLKEGFTSWVISEPPYWVRKSASNMNIRMILGYLTKETWHIKINNVGHELRILSQQAISGLHLSTQTS